MYSYYKERDSSSWLGYIKFCQQVKRSDPAPLLSTDMTSLGLDGAAGVSPLEGHKDDERTMASLL